jgi:hypothetical protein
MNKSSSPKRLRLVFIESFTVKRAINVHTTTASKIHETTLRMVPGSAIGALRRLERVCIILSSLLDRKLTIARFNGSNVMDRRCAKSQPTQRSIDDSISYRKYFKLVEIMASMHKRRLDNCVKGLRKES